MQTSLFLLVTSTVMHRSCLVCCAPNPFGRIFFICLTVVNYWFGCQDFEILLIHWQEGKGKLFGLQYNVICFPSLVPFEKGLGKIINNLWTNNAWKQRSFTIVLLTVVTHIFLTHILTHCKQLCPVETLLHYFFKKLIWLDY